MSMLDTIWPADSVEFCPHPNYANLLVCGTYYLEPQTSSETNLAEAKKQKRRGQCLVLNADTKISKIHEIDFPAVLDMKWCHKTLTSKPLLAVASSEGGVSLLEWDDTENRLKETQTVACATDDTLCLSLDWSNRRNPTDTMGSLIVSLSDGNLCLLQPDQQGGLYIIESWHAHDFEPWIAAWNYWDTNVIYSGGDDLKMKAWDIRQSFASSIFTNKRFEGGITSIQSHFHIEHLLAVGSYDSTVRLYDTRKPLVPISQASVGGGAWRVKWHPSALRSQDLLVACMHDGFKVIRFDADGTSLLSSPEDGTIRKRFDEHESLAYGVDWSFGQEHTGDGGETMIASGSFYDHSLHLWTG